MRIILNKDYEQLGKIGDIINVKDGFARNFLIPQNIAIPATQSNIKRVEEQKKQQTIRFNKEKQIALKLSEKMNMVHCTVFVQVGEEDKLFGAVTAQDVANLLKEKGFEIDKRKIQLDEPIKSLGIHDIKIKLHPEVEVLVKVDVQKKA
jgi:large subunit ribosomal protein L9